MSKLTQIIKKQMGVIDTNINSIRDIVCNEYSLKSRQLKDKASANIENAIIELQSLQKKLQ